MHRWHDGFREALASKSVEACIFIPTANSQPLHQPATSLVGLRCASSLRLRQSERKYSWRPHVLGPVVIGFGDDGDDVFDLGFEAEVGTSWQEEHVVFS